MPGRMTSSGCGSKTTATALRRRSRAAAGRGVEEVPVPAMHAVEDAERHDGRPDGRDVERHSLRVLRQRPSRAEARRRQRPDADQLARLVEDLDAGRRRAVVDRLRRAVHEAPAPRRSRATRPAAGSSAPTGSTRLGQPTLGGERLEPVGRERVLRAQAGGLGAAQGVEVAAACPAARRGRARSTGRRCPARSAGRRGRPASPRRRVIVEHVDRVDRDRPRREIDRLTRARRAVGRATRRPCGR